MSEQTTGRRAFEPLRAVRVLHDDGHWYRGAQFGWVRWPSGEWRAGITYSTAPGAKYVRSVSPDQLIAEV
jgi:hypothetical protein